VQYGKNLREREKRMIEDCDSAVVIWMNKSRVIAENLELLKRLGKPTFLYECSDKTDEVSAGGLDPNVSMARIAIQKSVEGNNEQLLRGTDHSIPQSASPSAREECDKG
jgi:hypothetical protein